MSEEVTTEEIDYKEQYGVLSEDNKKLKIDIASLQLSNRSLVNQNRDEKKKVMDCRLQIADLEGRMKTFETTKQDLLDCQSQIERLRMTLESNEAKLTDAERRADEANGLIKIEQQKTDYDKLNEKCTALETRIKEIAQNERRYGSVMGSRLIGPTLPPWLADEKKIENDLERLSNLDPAALRAKVMELENQVFELNELLTYREDVILRIHEEISKKAAKLEANDVERSSLNAQISILKRELATARDDVARRGGGGPAELEAEFERLRSKRDREYQRRKRIEAEADGLQKENHDIRRRIKELEEAVAHAPPKPVVPQSDPSDRQRIAELQGTVNQLRMDNEAKRSELFDLRSRFDAKSLQSDKAVAELKVKERSCAELTTHLNNTRSQLEATTKELEDVRCRAVRGGAEAERWQSDITSLQVTNKFLSSQVNDMRLKLLMKERLISEMTNRLQQTLNSSDMQDESCNGSGTEVAELVKINGVAESTSDEVGELTKTPRQPVMVQEFTATYVPSELESKLAAAKKRALQLEQDLLSERKAGELSASKVAELTDQVNQLESSLSEIRTQLMESQSERRKLEADAVPVISPPAKRTRRSGSGANSKAAQNHQECASCTELHKQIQTLEGTISDCTSRESDMTNQMNSLREDVATAQKTNSELRGLVYDLRDELAQRDS